MADVDHPKTHVEDQIAKGDVDLPRTQPESPQREGIDPLTEGDTMYPAENTKELSEKLERKELNAELDTTETDTLVADQEEVSAKANTPNANLPDGEKTPTTKEQAKADSASDGSGVDASKATPNDTPSKPASK